jgi:predicted alpha-1,2-mannosidase
MSLDSTDTNGIARHAEPAWELRMPNVNSRIVRAAVAAAAGGLLVPLALAGTANAASSAASGPAYVSDPASLVNPFIATTNGGDDFPGADSPLGMVQWSPDTTSRPDGGGYDYGDSSIVGYGLTHLSGPGCPAEGDVPILPTVGAVGTSPTSTTEPLDHSDEKATPGYYQLTAGGVETQLTTTPRTGFAKFTYPSTTSANLLFKLSDSETADTATSFQVVNDKEIAGTVTSGEFCGATNTYTLHFTMEFSQPFTASGTWTNGTDVSAGASSLSTKMPAATEKALLSQDKAESAAALAADGETGASSTKSAAARTKANMAAQAPVSDADGAYLTFDTTTNHVVEAKVGISYVSTDNAALNLSAEDPGWDFAGVTAADEGSWNKMLSKIQVGGGTPAQQAIFYTSLYHSLLHPNVASDVNGQYMGFNGKVEKVPAGHAEYANYSGWDIYRGQMQLLSMLDPKAGSDIVNSMLDDYTQTGMLPKWNEENGESYVMVGDPADAIIADAYAFGAKGYNATQALSDMETEATVPGNIRPGLNYYESDGYLPTDGTYGCCNFYGSVSTQEEYNVADNAISLMAQSLGKSSAAATFAARANNWQNVLNPGSGFMQPKQLNGAFQPGFDPTSGNEFVEADSYVYTAELPFDVAGLVKAEGGDANWVSFLNGLDSSVTAQGPTQIQMTDEESFDIPWEYDYAGAPYDTQKVVREIQDEDYFDTPAGLTGNDDLGAMSSWYVWSALGGYPEDPGSATLAAGSPLFPNIAIHLGDGKTITETAPAAADDAPYVTGLTINGATHDQATLPSSLFSKGGTVNWDLSTTPDTGWAAASGDAPPSNTSSLLPALGYLSGSNTPQIVTAPGTSTTLTLGVQSMSSANQDITWSASPTSGSGITLGSSTGTISVANEAKATQAIKVNVPSTTPDGDYQVTFSLRTATGTTLPSVVEEVAVASPGDLAPYFNNTGISADGTQSNANYDGDGYSYSATALSDAGVTPGATVTSGGINYTWPDVAAGDPDNVAAGGQTITVPAQSGQTELGFLGAATDGPSTGTATVTYTNGTSQTVTLDFSDWTLNADGASPVASDTTVASMTYRNGGGTPQTVGTYLFATEVPVESGLTVASVTLPSSTNNGGTLHVFAMGTNEGPLTSTS